MIDKSEECGWIVKDLCRVFPNLFAVTDEENMLLATSVILRRFFFLPMSDSMDISIELTLIASLFSRFLDLCNKILECLDVKSNVSNKSNFIVARRASRQ